MTELTFLQVPVTKLRPNPWNPNEMDPEMYRKAVVSIRSFGFVDPITVRKDKRGYEIIDGENRWRAAQDEGLTDVPIVDLGDVPDHVAQQLTIVLNETRGQPDPTRLGQLLKQLMDSETKETLLDRLPYSREAFDGLIGLPTINWQEPQRQLEKPKGAVAGWVERTYRLPKEVAEHLDRTLDAIKEERGVDSDWQAVAFLRN